MTRERARRVREAIREEISTLIRSELKDPRIGFASITGVELTDDLRHARVFVSVLGGEEERRQTLAGLETARGFLRGELARRLRLRFAPELAFAADDSIEHGIRINRLLTEIDAYPRGGATATEDENGGKSQDYE